MTDFHTHILPGVDDGSATPEQSVQMLKKLASQGVEAVALTPHFYAGYQRPEEFLQMRAEAFERLRPHLTPDLPAVRLGTEVMYFRGVSRMERPADLCLDGTRLFMLEMPTDPWTESEIGEVRALSRDGEVTVMLAHIDRYFMQQKRAVWEALRNDGVLFQVNAEAFTFRRMRRAMLRLAADGGVYALGSDCHDLTDRPPNMDEARREISERLPSSVWERLDSRSWDD